MTNLNTISNMTFLNSLIFWSSWATVAFTFPRNTFDNISKRTRVELESSGSGPDEPVRGIVKVVQMDPHALTQSSIFRRGLSSRRVPSLSSRLSFPSFLSQGRPGLRSKAAVSPLHHLHPKTPTETELKKRQGLQMWQKAIDKGDKMSLPVNLKDTKQTCSAVPFTQRLTADGCETVTVHNKLCFGQCSSLFVPFEGEFPVVGSLTGTLQRRTPCSRCAPSKAHTVTVPLRCGRQIREKQVLVVEECKCETGREEKAAEATLL